jgi:hypothetical protein
VRAESLTVSQEAAVSEKSSENNLGYAAKREMVRHQSVLYSPMWLGLENFLKSSTIGMLQN